MSKVDVVYAPPANPVIDVEAFMKNGYLMSESIAASIEQRILELINDGVPFDNIHIHCDMPGHIFSVHVYDEDEKNDQ